MATFDYVAIQAEAKAILDEFGMPLKVTRFKDTVDPVAGSVTRAAELEQTLIGAVLPASQDTLAAFDVRFMSDVIDSTDVRFVIMAAQGSTFVPSPKDEVTFWEPGVWEVLGCTPLNVAGVPLIYSVGLRKP